MKQIFILLICLATLPLHAQDVWKEGTQWRLTYDDGSYELFYLEGHTTIEGVDYLNLNVFTTNGDYTYHLGLIRSERGDRVVYFRENSNAYETEIDGPEDVGKEFSLYNFGTFEPDTKILYSVCAPRFWNYILYTKTIDGDSLSYYHDVIEPGDILPCYHNIIYKVGHINGPLYLLYIEYEPSPTGPDTKPKRKNISHTVLKLNDREVILSGLTPITIKSNNVLYYNLQGTQVLFPRKGIYITNGGVKVVIH